MSLAIIVQVFLLTKSEEMMVVFTDLRVAGIKVQFMCCDYSEENNAFQNECKSKGLKILFEFLGPRIPQQNRNVERKILSRNWCGQYKK
jgi:hypothetical protein